MFNFSPAPQIPNDVQGALRRACSSQKLSPLRSIRQLQGVIKGFDFAHPNHPDRERFIDVAGALFSRVIEAGYSDLLTRFKFEKGVAAPEPLSRFATAAMFSTLLSTSSVIEQRTREIDYLCAQFRDDLTRDANRTRAALVTAAVAERPEITRAFIDRLEQRVPGSQQLVIKRLSADSSELPAFNEGILVKRLVAFYEEQEGALRRDVIISILMNLTDGLMEPSPQALKEIAAFCRDAGTHFLTLVRKERENAKRADLSGPGFDQATAVNLLAEISSAVL